MRESPLKPRHYVMILLGLSLVAFALFAEGGGKSRAKTFCTSLTVGLPIGEVVQRAKADGGRTTIRDDRITVTFSGVTTFSRHICAVRIVDGKVGGTEYTSLD